MAKKAKCFIQVAGEAKGSYRKTIPVMRDWIALLPNPVALADVATEALRYCEDAEIISGEVTHYHKISVVTVGENG